MTVPLKFISECAGVLCKNFVQDSLSHSQLPVTEVHTYHLSTAENELGVVMAYSDSGTGRRQNYSCTFLHMCKGILVENCLLYIVNTLKTFYKNVTEVVV